MTLTHRVLWVTVLAFVLGVATGGGPIYLFPMTKASPPASTGIIVVDDTAYSGTTAPLYPVTFEAKNLPSGAEWTVTVGAEVASGSGPDLVLLMPNGGRGLPVFSPGSGPPEPRDGPWTYRG
jgi:hypothetical protein